MSTQAVVVLGSIAAAVRSWNIGHNVQHGSVIGTFLRVATCHWQSSGHTPNRSTSSTFLVPCEFRSGALKAEEMNL